MGDETTGAASASDGALIESLQREPGLPRVHIRRPRRLPPDRALGLRLRIGPKDPLWDTDPLAESLMDVRAETQSLEETATVLSEVLERYAIDSKRLELPVGLMVPRPTDRVRLLAEISGLRNNKGVCAVTLFNGPAGFPGDAQRAIGSVLVPVETMSAPHRAVAVFEGISPGVYAVGLLHDENQNGKLDTFLGIPREGYGFSGGGVARTGPPKFDACRFMVADSSPVRRITVPTTYLGR